MSGTILENLSNRKLSGVLSIIFFILAASFLIGAFITPPPSSPEQFASVRCKAKNGVDWYAPRDPGGSCEQLGAESQGNTVFAFQMPLPRSGNDLDYSRWFQNMLTLVNPEVYYDSRIADNTPQGIDKWINASVLLNVRIGVRDIGETKWREYYQKDNLKRTMTCKIPAKNREQGHLYDCDLIQLFELQSLYYDFYLINIEFINSEVATEFGYFNSLMMVAIHQNGGFTQVWLLLKSFFSVITLSTLAWYWHRLGQLGRDTNLLEKSLIMLGLGISQLNIPVEYLSLFLDLEFMSFLGDIRQGIFHCSLLIFWIIFIGEHLLDDVRRVGLASYNKQLATILVAYVSLFVFESTERGIQVVDPFFSIWEVNSNFAMICITITILFAIGYFVFLTYHLWLAFHSISTKQQNLPSMPTARRLIYRGVIYRFKFLLVFTFVCAASTVVAYIMGQVSEDQWYWDDSPSFIESLNWSSAMFTTVFALWNCYVITLLILYAPSHKGLGAETDEMSVEFTRLTDNDRSEGSARISYSTRSKRLTSDVSLLEIATKQNLS